MNSGHKPRPHYIYDNTREIFISRNCDEEFDEWKETPTSRHTPQKNVTLFMIHLHYILFRCYYQNIIMRCYMDFKVQKSMHLKNYVRRDFQYPVLIDEIKEIMKLMYECDTIESSAQQRSWCFNSFLNN